MLSNRDKTDALRKIEKLNSITKNLLKRQVHALDRIKKSEFILHCKKEIKELEEQKQDQSLENLNYRIAYLKERIPMLENDLGLQLIECMSEMHSAPLKRLIKLSESFLSTSETNEYFEKLLLLASQEDVNIFYRALPENTSNSMTPRAVAENAMSELTTFYRRSLNRVIEIKCYQSETGHHADLAELNRLDSQAEQLIEQGKSPDAILKQFSCAQVKRRLDILDKLGNLCLAHGEEKNPVHFSEQERKDFLESPLVSIPKLDENIKKIRSKLDILKISAAWIKEGGKILDELDSGLTHLNRVEELKKSGKASEFLIYIENLKEELYQQKFTKAMESIESLRKSQYLKKEEAESDYLQFTNLMNQAKITRDFKDVDNFIENLKVKIAGRENAALIDDLLSPEPVTPSPPVKLSEAPHATQFSPKASPVESRSDDEAVKKEMVKQGFVAMEDVKPKKVGKN